MAAAPIVFQCGGCRRVVSDSNQLLSAVADLDVLVLDAAVGLRTGPADDTGAYDTLHCAACGHGLGRKYRQPPAPNLAHLIWQDAAPRYCLTRSSLESYVLGSSSQHWPDETTEPGSGTSAAAANGSSHATQLAASEAGPATSRVEALERCEADARQQIAQLMRVVLALDQRVHMLEGDAAATGSKRKQVR